MIPVNWRRLWELHMLELRSRRSRLQQATTQEQEPDPIRSKNSSSLQASPPLHQDHSTRSRAKTNTTAAAKSITDEEELDDLEGRRGGSTQESRSMNRNTQRRNRQPLDDPPPPGHPPRNRTAIPKPRSAVAKSIANGKTLDDPEGKW